jgi:Co/Zn/Cd efflux system component
MQTALYDKLMTQTLFLKIIAAIAAAALVIAAAVFLISRSITKKGSERKGEGLLWVGVIGLIVGFMGLSLLYLSQLLTVFGLNLHK